MQSRELLVLIITVLSIICHLNFTNQEEDCKQNIIKVVAPSAKENCGCTKHPKGVIIRNKVLVTGCLLPPIKTVFQTISYIAKTTYTVTKDIPETSTHHKCQQLTSRTTIYVPTTKTVTQNVATTSKCKTTLTHTVSTAVTSTREFICYEEIKTTDTTVIIETSMVTPNTCTETQYETIYE